jgi:hypothetical protein
MKLSIVRGGGLAGIVTRTELDADRLPQDARVALEQKVASIGALGHPAPPASLPDELHYEVTIEDGRGKRAVHFSDSNLPKPLRELIEWADTRPERTTRIES